jgi:integrase
MGLGALGTVTLADARERARLARLQVLDGQDPIEARRARLQATRATDAKRLTFRDAAEKAIAVFRDEFRSHKHAGQWTATLERYAYPVIRDLSVAAVDTGHIMRILEPIWTTKHETARRLRQRIERILRWAAARGYRAADNPASLERIGPLLASGKKIRKVRHQPAMPYAEVPAFATELRRSQFVSARALEFTILTASRTGETIGARWDEIDIAAKLWTVPGERTKAGRPHRVPLSDRALQILAALPREKGNPFLFVGGAKGRGLSGMAMLELLRGMRPGLTVHGFRSSFRDWAAEQTGYPSEVAEAALGHVVGDKVEAAYRRGDVLEKRRRLMAAWADYCGRPPASGDVVPIQRAAHR